MAANSRKRASEASHLDAGDQNAGKSESKKAKFSEAGQGASLSHASKPSKTDANGDPYWEISKLRRVTISIFRGKTMVNIREYYEKDGQELPGKKGISLPMDQWSALVTLLPAIEDVLKQNEQSVPRPEYSVAGEPESDDAQPHDASPSKRNIEATSDEDEE